MLIYSLKGVRPEEGHNHLNYLDYMDFKLIRENNNHFKHHNN